MAKHGRPVSILSAAAYRSASAFGRVAPDPGRPGPPGNRRTHYQADYRRRVGVRARPILAPAGAAEWVTDREKLWQRVELAEKRKDALLARELIVTLPRDMPLSQAIAGLEAWAREQLVGRGMVADICVHAYGSPLDRSRAEHREQLEQITGGETWPSEVQPKDKESLDALHEHGPHLLLDRRNEQVVRAYQPHAHILLTTRPLDPDVEEGGFGANKDRDWGRKQLLYALRQSWEKAYNGLLEAQGSSARVTSKALWRRQKDGLAAADPWAQARSAGTCPPARIVNLDGGHHGGLAIGKPATKQRPPADPRPQWRKPLMRPIAFNRALAELRPGHGVNNDAAPAPTDDDKRAAEARLVELTALAGELMAKGVDFYATPSGALGYRAPPGVVTRDTYRRFGGMHEPLLQWLEETKKAATPPRETPPATDYARDMFNPDIDVDDELAFDDIPGTPAPSAGQPSPIPTSRQQLDQGMPSPHAEPLAQAIPDRATALENTMVVLENRLENTAVSLKKVQEDLIKEQTHSRKIRYALERLVQRLKQFSPTLGAWLQKELERAIAWAASEKDVGQLKFADPAVLAASPKPTAVPAAPATPTSERPVPPAATRPRPEPTTAPPATRPTSPPAAAPRVAANNPAPDAPTRAASPLALPRAELWQFKRHVANFEDTTFGELDARLMANCEAAQKQPKQFEALQLGACLLLEVRKQKPDPPPLPAALKDFLSTAVDKYNELKDVLTKQRQGPKQQGPSGGGELPDRDQR